MTIASEMRSDRVVSPAASFDYGVFFKPNPAAQMTTPQDKKTAKGL
jgi:hypothetical protein